MFPRARNPRWAYPASLLLCAALSWVAPRTVAQETDRPAEASEAARAFRAIEQDLYTRHRSRLAAAGGRLDRVERAHHEQGRELVRRWTDFLEKYPGDRALAFRARNYLVQGHHLVDETAAALRLLGQMEAEARTAEEILSVAMGVFHVRDSMDAGAQVLDRFAARQEDPELIAAVTLDKRMFVAGGSRDIRRTRRLEIARRVAQAHPETAAGHRAALIARALQLAPGHPALDMAAFRDVQGNPIELAAYRGKVLLLHFWGATIGECVREIPAIVAAFRAYHGDGLEVLSVSVDRDRAQAEGAARHHGMSWRHHCDGRGWSNEIAVRYEVDTLPWSILIGPDGRVVAVNPDPQSLPDQVAKALAMRAAVPPDTEPDTPRRSDPR